jgi:hypothetical protein
LRTKKNQRQSKTRHRLLCAIAACPRLSPTLNALKGNRRGIVSQRNIVKMERNKYLHITTVLKGDETVGKAKQVKPVTKPKKK